MNLQFSVPRPNMDIFRNARQNFLRRQQAAEEADIERQETHGTATPQPPAEPSPRREMQERSPGTSILSRFSNLHRPTLPSFMSGRSERNIQPRPSSSNYEDGDMESPKTPRFSLGMPNLPSTRLHLPNLTRTWTEGSNGPPSRPGTARSQHGGRRSPSRTRGERAPELTNPVPTLPAEHVHTHTRTRSGRRFDGADPADLHLASMAEDGRRRRHRHRHREPRHHHRRRHDADGRGRGEPRQPPKRFLFCFPWIRSRRIRSQILRCFVSGMFLALLLTVYLALSITKNINNSEFTVLLILIILFTTIFFCHGLIRLCMLIVKPTPEESEGRHNLPQIYGPGGYAIPRQPIRVVLARDEEAAGIESDANKIRPPAYGLWRESVRVDPNRIYWQRNEEIRNATEGEPRPSTRTGDAPRPPSYASDDGVNYVVEAQPRSVAPTTDVPLPQHPSEAGRVGRPAEW